MSGERDGGIPSWVFAPLPWLVLAAVVLAGCTGPGGRDQAPAAPSGAVPSGAVATGLPSGLPTGPALLAPARVAYHPDGSLASLRLVTPTALTEIDPDDPPGVRTRYVGWDPCPPGCGATGGYDVETRRLLAQGMRDRYPVPAGASLLVLAVRVDGPVPAECLEVAALTVHTADGARHRLTGPDGGPVVTVCPER